jgi:hypothetical protein
MNEFTSLKLRSYTSILLFALLAANKKFPEFRMNSVHGKG